MTDTQAPKLFISYCWTSDKHKEWVFQLATGLRENGVDVILDRWHLDVGQDTHVFMERMVNDPEINRVALICDRAYVEKANRRDGGVGIEAQIITLSIYESHQQTKFVALVTELDEQGKPYVPTYYGSKKWLKFFDDSTYSEDFETLLRWIFDKPLDKVPPLGKPPAFLTEDGGSITLATTSYQRRAIDALKNAKPNALAFVTEYLDRVIDELEKFRIIYKNDNSIFFDDLLVKNIEEFIPYRNELISCFLAAAVYANDETSWKILHRFFERLISFRNPPPEMRQFHSELFDNFIFLTSELFLYLIACNLKYENFNAVNYFISTKYYTDNALETPQGAMKDFQIFKMALNTLNFRKRRLNLNLQNLESEFLKNRSISQTVSFDEIMTADFILYLRSKIHSDEISYWFPYTLVYLNHYKKIKLFVRAQSKKYFKMISDILGVVGIEDLKLEISKIDGTNQPIFGYSPLQAGFIMNIDSIAKEP